jgi:hypothetical protein
LRYARGWCAGVIQLLEGWRGAIDKAIASNGSDDPPVF